MLIRVNKKESRYKEYGNGSNEDKDRKQWYIVILGCESGEEMIKLKTTVQSKLGDNFKVIESLQKKPKLKIVYIDEEESKLSDEELIDSIKKQNKFGRREESMRIVKRLKTQSNKDGVKQKAL